MTDEPKFGSKAELDDRIASYRRHPKTNGEPNKLRKLAELFTELLGYIATSIPWSPP